jgi:hypothetical protein
VEKKEFFMAIQTLYPNDQTRRAVISAYQGNAIIIGWVLDSRGAGAIFNPAWPFGDQLRLIPNVSSTLTNLAPSAGLLVFGNSGLAITNGINKSTYGKMLADDHVSARIISRAHLSS